TPGLQATISFCSWMRYIFLSRSSKHWNGSAGYASVFPKTASPNDFILLFCRQRPEILKGNDSGCRIRNSRLAQSWVRGCTRRRQLDCWKRQDATILQTKSRDTPAHSVHDII